VEAALIRNTGDRDASSAFLKHRVLAYKASLHHLKGHNVLTTRGSASDLYSVVHCLCATAKASKGFQPSRC
jgi:hypothetical protein